MKFHLAKITSLFPPLTSPASHSNKGALSSAALSGHGDVPFEKAVYTWLAAEQREGNIEFYSCRWHQGWCGRYAPDATGLTPDKTAMSFVISFTAWNDDVSNKIVLYFVYDETAGALSVHSCLMDEYGYIHVFSAGELKHLLAAMYNERI